MLPHPVAKSVIEPHPRSPAGQGGYYKEPAADPEGVATEDSLGNEWGKRQDDEGGIEWGKREANEEGQSWGKRQDQTDNDQIKVDSVITTLGATWGKRDIKLPRDDLTAPDSIGGHFSGESRVKRQSWDCSGLHGHVSLNGEGDKDWKRSPSKRTPQGEQDRGGKIAIARDDDGSRANQTPAKNPSPPAIAEKRDEVDTTNQTPAFDSAKNPSSGAYKERREATGEKASIRPSFN